MGILVPGCSELSSNISKDVQHGNLSCDWYQCHDIYLIINTNVKFLCDSDVACCSLEWCGVLYVSQCWMFGSKTRPLWLALPSSTHLSFLTLSSALNTVTAVTAAAGVITSIAVTRSLDDAMISCVYRRPPLMHMAIGYRCLPKIIELDFLNDSDILQWPFDWWTVVSNYQNCYKLLCQSR